MMKMTKNYKNDDKLYNNNNDMTKNDEKWQKMTKMM
jgi:hypothetical protein